MVITVERVKVLRKKVKKENTDYFKAMANNYIAFVAAVPLSHY